MTVEESLARLTAGLAEDERIAQAAAPRWQDDFTDNPDAYGHLGGYVHDHAERFSPRRSSAQVEALRLVIADYERAVKRREGDRDPYVDSSATEDGWAADVHIATFESVLSVLASIYPDPTEEA